MKDLQCQRFTNGGNKKRAIGHINANNYLDTFSDCGPLLVDKLLPEQAAGAETTEPGAADVIATLVRGSVLPSP